MRRKVLWRGRAGDIGGEVGEPRRGRQRVELEPELIEALEALALDEGVTLERLIVRLINEGLEFERRLKV